MNIASDKNTFTFVRKNYVKDLFNDKDIFSKFSIIEFKSFTAFFNFMQKGLWSVTGANNYIINIKTKEELEAFLQVINATHINDSILMTIKYDSDILDNIVSTIPVGIKLELSADHDTVEKLAHRKSELLDSILHWTEYTFTANNFDSEYEKLIKLCIKDPRFTWIDLSFDYASFEDKKLSDLHKLCFYMNQFRLWKDQEQIIPNKRIELKNRNSCLKCWVDENLDIGLNKNEIYFDMSKYLGKNGEDIPLRELNEIRKIVDIKFVEPGINNLYLVNLCDNQKVMGDYYRIPYITSLIAGWLNV